MNYFVDLKEDIDIGHRKSRDNFSDETKERMEFALSVINFNQGLIQFAETKANTLLIINSIFLATVTAMMEGTVSEGFLGIIFNTVRILFMVTTICSIITCLMVVMPKSDSNPLHGKKDLIFFMDILSHSNSENYMFEFHKTKSITLIDDLLRRGYMTATIAKEKFNRYKIAQIITFTSTFFWISGTCMYFFK
ncbi:MAG: Pycsar system effector family protein [Candidatus Eremiobacterota bacterium]